MWPPMVVAIDGPAGAGKSTVARGLAERLGFRYVDTGAMYRAVALSALENGVDPADPGGGAAVASAIDIRLRNGGIAVDGRDVTGALRTGDVTRASAQVARHPGVRTALVAVQRRVASEHDVVMEGRDIGAVVLPGAEAKVFLTASVEERGRRRARELGVHDDETRSDITRAIAERDHADATRSVSPLKQAPDAHVVDTTGLSLDEVVERICGIARSVAGAR